MQRAAKFFGNKSNVGAAGNADKGYYDDFSDRRMLEIVLDMIENNRRREFLAMTFEISKVRLATLLITQIERNPKTIKKAKKYEIKKPNQSPAGSARGKKKITKSEGSDYGDKSDDSQEERDYWWTPLHYLCTLNRGEMVSASSDAIELILVNAAGTENWEDAFGQSPLHIACIKGHTAVCRMICKHAGNLTTKTIQYSLNRKKPGSNFLINSTDRIGCTPLHYVTLLQHRSQADELAKLLLSHTCDPNILDIDGFTPLGFACFRGTFEMVQLLLTYGSDPNIQSPEDGWTPFMLAAYAGHAKITNLLLNPESFINVDTLPPRGMLVPANPALANKLGATSLIVAAQNGQTEVVTTLLWSKHVVQTINYKDTSGRTALAAAAIKGHTQIVAHLLDKKAHPDLADNDGATPMMLAIYKGHRSVVDLLLQHNADVSLADKNGYTALMIAAEHGNAEVVRAVLTVASYRQAIFSVVANAQNQEGATALMFAAEGGNEKVIDTIMAAPTNLEPIRPIDDWTALFHAVYFQKTKPVRAMMAKHLNSKNVGALVNRAYSELNRHSEKIGLTPLLLACLTRNVNMARLLIDSGSVVNTRDKSFFTPLMAAVQNGEEKLVQLLLTKGAKTDYQEYDGYSALMIASLKGYLKICDMLLQHEANVNLQQLNGRTAMMFAAEHCYADILMTLIRHGGDLSVTDILTRTVLHYGIIGGNEKVMAILCDAPKIDPNVQDKNGTTPLMLAAANPRSPQEKKPEKRSGGKMRSEKKQEDIFSGHPAEILHIIPLLRHSKISLDLRDNNGDTALMLAYRVQNWLCAEALLRAKASPTILAGSDGFPPLIYAAINNDLPGIRLIKHICPRTVNVTDVYGRSALFHAVANDQFEAVNMLLSEPSPVDVSLVPSRSRAVKSADLLETPSGSETPTSGKMWFYGMSPLHAAAKRGHLEIAERLIEGGANLDQVNERQETPIMLAADKNYWDVVEMLLTSDADISRQDANGQTLLHRLCKTNDQYEGARGFRLVIKHRGAGVLNETVDAPTKNTALHLAVVRDLAEIVNEIIILGGDKTVRNKAGNRAGDDVVFGPLLFQSIGQCIGPLWRSMAKHLTYEMQRPTSNGEEQGIVDNICYFQDKDLDEIDKKYGKNDAHEHKRAAAMLEAFLNKCADSSTLDTKKLGYAWLMATGRDEHEKLSPVLSAMLTSCQGKTLVYNSATLENLTKVRSKSAGSHLH